MFPKIIIKYNRLLDPIFVFYSQNAPEWKRLGWDKWVPPDKKELDKRIENYQKAWKLIETKVITALCDVLGLNFRRNIIDVHIVSGNPRQISRPLIIKSGYPIDEFLNILIHELIHVLLSDNEEILPRPEELFSSFPDETKLTKNHILVHAMLKYIYLNVLKEPERLNNNIVTSRKHSTSEYYRAWEIVEKEGYLEIIDYFKKCCQRLLLDKK